MFAVSLFAAIDDYHVYLQPYKKTRSQGETGQHVSGNVMVDRIYSERAGNVECISEMSMSHLIPYFPSW